MDKDEILFCQLIELDHSVIEDGMNHFFCNQYNWKEDILDVMMEFLLEKNEDYYLECYHAMCRKLVQEVSEANLVTYFEIEGTPEYNTECSLCKLETLLEEHGFIYHRVNEDGKCVGVEFEGHTELGVNMVHFVDGRDADLTQEDWYYHELQDIYENFDVDEEIDLHREGEDYKKQFSIRESLEDFEKWEKRLKFLYESA